jgi:sulfite reductase (NADPH) flavoprotein alpha-component
VLTRIDVAFSRDQAERIYVQHRLREQGAELWRWLQDGAYLYVCGDAQRMAPDVHAALLDVAREQGGLDADAAAAWLNQLQRERRYQRDVY